MSVWDWYFRSFVGLQEWQVPCSHVSVPFRGARRLFTRSETWPSLFSAYQLLRTPAPPPGVSDKDVQADVESFDLPEMVTRWETEPIICKECI